MEDTFINPFYIPSSSPGGRKAYSTSYGNAAFRQAVVTVSARWTRLLVAAKAAGRYNGKTTVSPDTLLMNFALRGNRTSIQVIMIEVQQEYKRELQENHNAKKSIDGIKSS